ncbi:laminin subunit gamma-2 [Callorhinchus milii]|uniref:laminin subunit gamma-2 n=1 Tax=Callorhinchus milii TaxID=7868 RepID=UPI001C3F4F08|nr:laminin subunit gamma-2 [Callorhinchus milii]
MLKGPLGMSRRFSVAYIGTSWSIQQRLHEALMYGWKPFLTSKDFQRVLAGLKAIKIRGSYKPQSRGHLDDVVLYTARPGVGQRPAEWVERCTCPTGYEGDSASNVRPATPGTSPSWDRSCYPSDVAPVTCPDGYYTDPDNLSSCVKCPCPSRVGCTVSPATRDVVCMGCPPKTMGSRCEMCEEGYFGKPLAGRPCQPCMCNGNTDPNSVGNCDQDTGECLKCLYGTTGPHCERCKEGFLGNALNPQPSEKCKLCRCDPRGSWSSQCRSDGTCDCKPGVFGPQCDRCAGDRYYNSTTGCQECPSCYQAVLNKVAKHQTTVSELEILISKVNRDPDSVADKDFEERLRKTLRGVSEMVVEARTVKVDDEKNVRSLNTINRQLSSNTARLDAVKRTVDETRRLSATYDDQVRRTDQQLNKIRTEIQKARTEMTRIPTLPDNPRGDSNLVSLADEARRLADEHKRDADNIESLSESANDLSSSALQLIREVLDNDKKVTQSIDRLEQQFKENNDMVKDLEEQADRINTRSQKSSDRASQIFNELNNLPSIDINALTENANRLEIKETGIELDLNRKIDDYERRQSKLNEYQDDVRKLLEKGKIDQKTADVLLARAKAARDLADAAVRNGATTLEEVNRLLNNLKDFNGRVLNNQTAAEDALSKIPEISRTIDQANSKTKQAEDNLGNAVNTANEAKKKARKADGIADDVLKDAVKALDDTTRALNDVNSLAKDMVDLKDQLKDIETSVGEKRKLVDGDAKNANMTTEAIDKAVDNTANAKDAVSKATDMINQMLENLDNPVAINSSRLILVEQTLQGAKNQLNNGLKVKLRELEQAAASQKDTIAAFDRDIEDIRGDIKNLEEIRDAFPDGCFNAAAIEKQ